MISRNIKGKLIEISSYFPVVTVTGPRQSGKTTLIKDAFPNLPYELLESPDKKALVMADPRAFLDKFPNGAILDEVQNIPELFSYLQGIVDDNPEIKFILSGSQNFLLLEKITQTLAGRTGVMKLLPLSLVELSNTSFYPKNVFEFIFKGGYPRLYNQKIPTEVFYSSYIQTYVERDVRTITNIGDLNTFQTFLSLCAGRVGQILNVDSLASDTGVTFNTAKKWLSILETSYIIRLLYPHHKNFNKRLIKSPKLYFLDTGLVSYLLRIKNTKQLENHFMRGALFENFVINELMKHRYNSAQRDDLYYWRDKHGKEIDCIIDRGEKLIPIEIKSGKTYTKDFFKGLNYWNKLSGQDPSESYVVYGGDLNEKLPQGNLISWDNLESLFTKMKE
tara:strand:+ start:35813 stop:36985 length:1173 start_codon:yes stop_codon:yes gene_type:complete